MQDCEYHVYDDYCSYTLIEWAVVDTVSLTGKDFDPVWPEPSVGADEQLGAQTETFLLFFKSGGDNYTYDTSNMQEWQRYDIGSEMKAARGMPAGFAPATTYWMVESDQTILGVSKLRHHLTPTLEMHGGHIAYYIRPTQRRQGYGGLLLALTLEKARARGINPVRVTCDTDNIGSARVIEKNGGVLSGQMIYQGTGRQISQYWIELS